MATDEGEVSLPPQESEVYTDASGKVFLGQRKQAPKEEKAKKPVESKRHEAKRAHAAAAAPAPAPPAEAPGADAQVADEGEAEERKDAVLSIDVVAQRMHTASLKERRMLLDRILRLSHTDFADEAQERDFLQKAAAALMQTATYWLDAPCKRWVESALQQLVQRRPRFVPAFAQAFVTYVKKHAKGLRLKDSYTLWRLSMRLLSCATAQDVESISKGLNVVLEQEVSLLEQLKGDELSAEWPHIRNLFLVTVKKHPRLMQIYIPLAQAAPAQRPFLINLILCYLTLPAGLSELETYRVQFLKWYADHVLSSKEVPSSLVREAYGPLLRVLQPKEFADIIQPAYIRAVYRTTEACLTSFSTALDFIQADLSSVLGSVWGDTLYNMRANEGKYAPLAVDVCCKLVPRVSDPSVLSAMLKEAIEYAHGKKGALPLWQQRSAFVQAIGALAEVKSGDNKQFAAEAIEGLVQFLEKEPAVEAREAAVKALCRFIAKHHIASDKAVAVLREGLKGTGKDSAIVACYAAALLELLSAFELEADKGGLAKQTASLPDGVQAVASLLTDAATVQLLTAYIETAAAKPLTHRRVGLLAAALLLRICPGEIQIAGSAERRPISPEDDEKAEGELTEALEGKDNKLGALLRPLLTSLQAFPHAPEHVLKSTVDDAAASLALFAAVLDELSVALAKMSPRSLLPFFQTPVRLLLCADAKVRRLARVQLSALLAAHPALADSLIPALSAILYAPSASAASFSPFHLSTALLTLSAYGASAAVLPDALFVAHDQRLVTAPMRPLALMDKMLSRWRRECKQPEEWVIRTLEGQLDRVKRRVFEHGLYSKDANRRRSAVGVIASLTLKAPSLVLNHILPGVLAMLEAKELLSKSAYEQAVFRTPDGQLCNYQAEGEYHSRSHGEGKNVRLKRGGGFSAREEEEWERQVREEIEKKKGIVKVDPKVQAKLEEEKQIRENIRQLLAPVESALEALNFLCRFRPRFAHDHAIPTALPRLYALLRNSISEPAAAHTHSQLAKTLDRQLKEHASVVALALQTVTKLDAKAWLDATYASLLPHALSCIAEAAHKAPFTPSSFLFVWPLLKTALLNSRDDPEAKEGDEEKSKKKAEEEEKDEDNLFKAPKLPKALPGHQDALRALAEHCRVSLPASPASYPLGEMVSVLLHTLAKLTELKPATHAALLRMAPVLRASEAEILASDAGLLSPQADVRQSALKALEAAPLQQPLSPLLLTRLWVACHDAVPQLASEAERLWLRLRCQLGTDYAEPLLELLAHKEEAVRHAAGLALAGACRQHPAAMPATLEKIMDLFKKSVDEVIESQGGLRTGPQYIYRYPTRCGCAQALAAAVGAIRAEQLKPLFTFFMEHGLADLNDEVWEEVIQAALRAIEVHGAAHLSTLLSMFEAQLEKLAASKGKGAAAQSQDRVREGVVVLMGTLARHLDPSSPWIKKVMQQLVEVLRTPSHSVQEAAADCIAPLMPLLDPSEAERLVRLCVERVAHAENYGERMGAAFGLAAMVKGLKPACLSRFGILDTLQSYMQGKSIRAKQGALFAYTRLFSELGPLFEPYIPSILPLLLSCFGETLTDVREAAHEAARVMMRNLTGQGVRMVLPLVLKSLDDKQWRAKTESIAILGSMAYCAPKQLSACLPLIVPRLLEVMADPHAKVQQASKTSLEQIVSVIRNPELYKIRHILHAALLDPAATAEALQALSRTTFVHSIDPPSLAIIVPLLRKGFRDRLPASKLAAAQVAGSLCALVGDVADLLPYANTLLKYLKLVLMDPIPEVRSVAAKAIGALYQGLGEHRFAGLVEWLLTMLKSETAVQRSGAAMGLAQVLHTLGVERTQLLLPDLIEGTRDPEGIVREGYYGLFIHLPEAFGHEYHVFLDDTLPVVLAGLQDSLSPVRDLALKAGQVLIHSFARSHTDLLLTPLERGLRDQDWRIRLATCHLTGSLLLRLAGVHGKLFVGDTSEDEAKDIAAVSSRAQEKAIEEALGTARRNELFASIYLMRSDVIVGVRNMAWRVWKAVVFHGPRMLRTILPTLITKVIYDLASEDDERQTAAGHALRDLVAKMGDQVLQQIIPILQERLQAPDASSRKGVCHGLAEIMEATTKAQISAYMLDIIPAVRDALCDEDEEVRIAAGRAFETLYSHVGKKAIDEIVPSLLEELGQVADKPEASLLVLDGVRTVLEVCGGDVLPIVIPQLLTTPMTVFNARALAAIVGALEEGSGFYRYVQKVCSCFVEGMAGPDEEINKEIREAAERLMHNIKTDSAPLMFETLTQYIQDGSNQKHREAAAQLISAYCSGPESSIEPFLDLLLKTLLGLFVDANERLQEIAVATLESVNAAVPADVLMEKIPYIRDIIKDISEDKKTGKRLEEIPAFSNKKGLGPVLPIFQHGLLHGAPELREQAALGLGELIELTANKALAASVMKVTGNLIRIASDRFPGVVKAAILRTLGLLLNKTGVLMKSFVPQLQTTFLKALHDQSQSVRDRASRCLADLMSLSRRIDPVITELLGHAKTAPDTPVRATMLTALGLVLENKEVQAQISPAVFSAVPAACLELRQDDKEEIRIAAAQCYGVVARYLPLEEVTASLKMPASGSGTLRDGHLRMVAAVFENIYDQLDASVRAETVDMVTTALRDEHHLQRCCAIAAAGRMMRAIAASSASNELLQTLATGLAKALSDEVSQVRHDAAVQMQMFGEVASQAATASVSATLVPALVSRMADSSSATRNAVHRALYTVLQFHRGQDAANKAVAAAAKRIAESESKDAAETFTNFCKRTLTKLKYEPLLSDPLASAGGSSNGAGASA